MNIKIVLLSILMILSTQLSAEEILCKEIKSKGEGHWPIPEKAFTKERYDKAIYLLNDLSNRKEAVADYVTIENEMIYIEGYFLRFYAQSGDEDIRKQFCDFIYKKAYVRH